MWFDNSDFCLFVGLVWFSFLKKRVWHFSNMNFVNETKVKVSAECGLNWFRSCSVCGQQIVLNFEPFQEFNNWLNMGSGMRGIGGVGGGVGMCGWPAPHMEKVCWVKGRLTAGIHCTYLRHLRHPTKRWILPELWSDAKCRYPTWIPTPPCLLTKP